MFLSTIRRLIITFLVKVLIAVYHQQCVLLDNRAACFHYLSITVVVIVDFLWAMYVDIKSIFVFQLCVSLLLLKPLKYLIPPVDRLNEHAHY